MSGNNIIKGDIYWVKFDHTVGAEIKKTRPAIIASNNIQNKFSSRVIVVPLSTKLSKIYDFEVELNINGIKSRAMIDQIRAIDKSRLRKYISTVTKQELAQINTTIKLVLSLE